ncbi:guanyl-specific ribonuclease Sa [Kibdelosporangium banguiense]|uniref:Guanyl-specific ribonuclease Sa n=1 Tax=Kibdelosporangium banguiense TaxID=1365924 RepID=A0ABS4T601_9PSEU|nr:ribonuclease domain-containing protein [Kibdelosporangium banguiense]MBP2319716.1 guanyl-specific ribonuclease Sa [Kibdelosporangium banguiense]
MGSRKRITFALIGLVVLVVAGWFVREAATDSALPGDDSGLQVKALSTLPREATDTWRLIEKGGPFKSNRDGVVFENREKRLPAKPGSYYREYTVPTPGSNDRGARRLVYGQERELYYTGDHYVSFVLVDPGK